MNGQNSARLGKTLLYYSGSRVYGVVWLPTVVTIRLSRPSLAGVGAWTWTEAINWELMINQTFKIVFKYLTLQISLKTVKY